MAMTRRCAINTEAIESTLIVKQTKSQIIRKRKIESGINRLYLRLPSWQFSMISRRLSKLPLSRPHHSFDMASPQERQVWLVTSPGTQFVDLCVTEEWLNREYLPRSGANDGEKLAKFMEKGLGNKRVLTSSSQLQVSSLEG
jgi:hypothetical protein